MTVEHCISFLQKLIQTPSLPGKEGDIAGLVLAEMETLGYDAAWVDGAGNAIGLIRGRGEAPSIMFNTHLDHVDPGDPNAWPHPPYSGKLVHNKVWGRGACDIKGPLAAQLYGAAAVLAENERPAGDVYVTAVVQEEIGGLGARFLLTHLVPELAVVGEPSGNTIRRGHRGRTELVLHIKGRATHASVPHRAINPLYIVSGFLQQLQTLKTHEHPELGVSTVAPTLIRTDQISPNVIPEELWLTLDWRNIPGERAEDARDQLLPLLAASLPPEATAEIEILIRPVTSYTGLTMNIAADNPAYSLPSESAVIKAAVAVLGEALGQEMVPRHWQFATDGGHFAQAGMQVVGYGPGDETLAHTTREHITVDEIETALRGNAALARALAQVYRAHQKSTT